MQYPKRTHHTSIPDGILVLMDFLFDALAPIHLLRQNVFSIHHNVQYTHGLNDNELESALETCIMEGTLFSRQGEFKGRENSFYGLTSKGGHLWEKERQPIWRLYVEDSYEPTRNDTQCLVHLKSTSIETLKEFLNFYTVNTFHGAPLTAPVYNVYMKSNFIYWKEATTVHEYTYLAIDSNGWDAEDWEKYYNESVWWRSIEELQKFA